MKSFDEKMKESQERVKREQEKQKAWIAKENSRKRKERNSRIFAVGAHVEHVIGTPADNESAEEYKARVERLLRIGIAADDVLQRSVNPVNFKYFLMNQQERGNYFSRFMDQRNGGMDAQN